MTLSPSISSFDEVVGAFIWVDSRQQVGDGLVDGVVSMLVDDLIALLDRMVHEGLLVPADAAAHRRSRLEATPYTGDPDVRPARSLRKDYTIGANLTGNGIDDPD